MRKYNVNVNGTNYDIGFAAPSTTGATAPAAPVSAGGADIKAPVAGTILKLVAPAGSNVKAGDTVIMVESMKMELEVKATADGKIDYTVAQGAAIQAGQVIATIGGGAVAAPVAQPANAAPAAPDGPRGY